MTNGAGHGKNARAARMLHEPHPDEIVEARAKAIYLARHAAEGGRWNLVEEPEPWWALAFAELPAARIQAHVLSQVTGWAVGCAMEEESDGQVASLMLGGGLIRHRFHKTSVGDWVMYAVTDAGRARLAEIGTAWQVEAEAGMRKFYESHGNYGPVPEGFAEEGTEGPGKGRSGNGPRSGALGMRPQGVLG